MTRNELREYLKRIYEIEKNIYEEENVRNHLENKLNKQVKYYKIEAVEEPTQQSSAKKLFYGAIVLFIFATSFFFVGLFYTSSTTIQKALYFIAIFFGLCGIQVSTMYTSSSQAEEKQKDKIAQIIHENEIATKKNELIQTQAHRDRVSANTQLKILDQMLSESKQVREKYYTLNIIHPKYRNLIAISSIYEYIDTGRCHELEGPHGAYDTYEYMKELNEIKTDIRIVINQLDQIRRNQEMLYYAINESNRLSRAMIDSFQRTENMLIQTNQSLTDISEYQRQSAEYNRITANNTEFFKWLTIFQSAKTY